MDSTVHWWLSDFIYRIVLRALEALKDPMEPAPIALSTTKTASPLQYKYLYVMNISIVSKVLKEFLKLENKTSTYEHVVQV